MTGHRWPALLAVLAVATSLIAAAATALAAPGSHHVNYRGPARPARAVQVARRTNYHGPARARTPMRASNRPGSGSATLTNRKDPRR